MKSIRIGFALLALSSALDAHADAVTYIGGDGSSFDKAIIEKGVVTDGTATDAEYAYLRQHFPGYHMIRQSLLNHGGKVYDLLDFTDANSRKQQVYFDITATFGKLQ